MDCLLVRGYGVDQAVVPLGSKMEDGAAREDACREYQSSLEDLTFNSKPHINMLTILAEENLQFAKDIVAIIEAQILKAPAGEKLPVLYLVDSIVKNVGGEYLAVFAKNLITSFICVFEKVEENTRKSLFKLRSTWDEVFPNKSLYELDLRVSALDPAWPVKAPPTVNASIHVNPRFLKQPEDAAPSQPASPPPGPPPGPPPPVPPPAQASLTKEQEIRQQLLAKQKQLLELQQKKIELELEQTKAQLAGGFVLPTPPPPAVATAPKPSPPPPPLVRPWVPPPAEPKPPSRDPRLKRDGPPPPAPGRRDGPPHAATGPAPHAATGPAPPGPSPAPPPERRAPERPAWPQRPRPPRREAPEDKAKSPSPLAKAGAARAKMADAKMADAEVQRKDPRARKRAPEHRNATPGAADEPKEKRRGGDKREAEPRGKRLLNGAAPKHDEKHAEKHGGGGEKQHGGGEKHGGEKPDPKAGGNARTHARKRTRSRSPAASPKRKERRSPKSRARSGSPSPGGKPRGGGQGGGAGGAGPHAKKSQSEGRRSKRPGGGEGREARGGHDGGGKDGKEGPHRWRSGWEESKHLKLPADPSPQRHKPYGGTRPAAPRTPKHRLSVDANLQIPDVLNCASKKDLLRRASKRLESGEISQEDFLNMAHQIKHFFQYQEEKQQRSEGWDSTTTPPPLLGAAQQRPPMDEAERSYYQHKLKLRKTQVNHRAAGEDWEGEEPPEDLKAGPEKAPLKYGRAPRDRPGERRSKEREEPPGPMIEDYNHGKAFPALKTLPGLRFRRRADPKEASEREWTSPLTERQPFEDRDDQKSSYDAPRRYGPAEPRRPEAGTPAPTMPGGGPEGAGPRFERERLSPLLQKEAELSPAPRFESPTSEHSDDGPLDPAPPRPLAVAMATARQLGDSPSHTPPHDPARYGGPNHLGPARGGWFEDVGVSECDPAHLGHGPMRAEPVGHGPMRTEPGHGPMRAEPGHGPMRAEPVMGHGPMRAEPVMGHGPMRAEPMRTEPLGHGPMRAEPMGHGPMRAEGPGPIRAEPMGHGPMRAEPHGPMRAEPHGPMRAEPHGPMRAEPVGHGPMRAEPVGHGPMRAEPMRAEPGHGPMRAEPHGPMRAEPHGPMRAEPHGPMRAEPVGRFPRYEGPAGGRFDGGARFVAMAPGAHGFPPRSRLYEGAAHYEQQATPPRYEYPGQQATPPRFPPRPLLYEGPAHAGVGPAHSGGGGGVPQGFVLAPQRFPEPAGSQFQTAPGGFSGQSAFSMAPAAAPFSQPGHAQFYNPVQQPVLMGNMNQNFLQNPVPFGPQAPQENHFGQVDVNDLLSKLISTGIIKPSQPDAAAAAPPAAAEPTAPPAPPPAAEEEEEEEQEEDEDLPDLTGFSIENMKLRYEGVVSRLYSGNQCCLCSMRFTPAQTDMYADHLDWHFRQNHAGKTAGKKITHRRWYYGLTDWVEFEEIADLEERAKSQFFEKENEEEVQKSQAAAKEKEFQSVRAAKDQVGELCEICQEPFETYWVEEEEDWFLKNALRVDDKNFHPSCFEDYQNTSSYLDVSPSPGRLQPDFPLAVKEEPEEPEEAEPKAPGAEPKAEGAEPKALGAEPKALGVEPKAEGAEPEPQEAPPQDPDPAPPAPPDLDPPASA